MRPDSVRSGIRWRRLTIHLAERTGSGTKALRRAVRVRCAVRFRCVLYARNLITLNLDGFLRFHDVLIELLQCSILSIHLLVQVTDVLQQQLFFRLYCVES